MKIFIKTKTLYIILFVIISTLLTLIYYYNSKKNIKSYTIPKNDEKVEIYTKEENKGNEELEKLTMLYNEKKLLVLTFDDGPGKYTEKLVDAMHERNIPVTFFILGQNVANKEDILKKEAIYNEINIHSYSHALFTKLSNEEITEDITKTREIIKEVTGKDTNIIRVPYGMTNTRVKNLLLDLNLTSVTWDVDSKDWSFRNTDKTYNYTLKYITGNNIILMHDIYETSVDAAIRLVDTLKDTYTFVTLSTYLSIAK
ncbi:MAG: polysaccharide deacetylase family protein [Clostridia bacterium]|nr:polysaccharide deacetylase family protein [Clostridia bacterium]